jgi:hypothetical protein
MPLTRDQKVDLLWDKLAIAELMNSFGRALDLHDWALYERCFCDPLEVDFQRLTGRAPVLTNPRAWARFAASALARLAVHHQYSNHAIRVQGDVATGTVYMVARHHSPDSGEWNTQYGWYENTFARCEGDFGWRIRRLKHEFQWISGAPELIDLSDPESARAMRDVFGD